MYIPIFNIITKQPNLNLHTTHKKYTCIFWRISLILDMDVLYMRTYIAKYECTINTYIYMYYYIHNPVPFNLFYTAKYKVTMTS